MENQSSSSGIFALTNNFGDSSIDSRQTGSVSNKSRRSWRSNHLHVHVQRHWLDRGRKFLPTVFRLPKRSRRTQEGFQLGHWSFIGPGEEEKWYGPHTYTLEGQWNKTRRCHVVKFQRKWTSDIPRFQRIQWRILEEERWKMHDPLQCGIFECRALLSHDSLSKSVQYPQSSSELVWRTDSADTWSNVLKRGEIRCEGERSVISKVGTARGGLLSTNTKEDDQAAADRMRIHHQRFEELSSEIQITKACESAGFMRRVSIGMYYKTIHDVTDGFGGKTGACREYSLPHDHQDSDPTARIGGHTNIDPVLQVKTVCCLDQYGIEIQVPSTSGDGSTSWIIMSRGPNRYVVELNHDPDNSPESREVANGTSVGRPHAIVSSIEETHASQPGTQSNLMNNHSEDFSRSTIGSGMIFLPTVKSKGGLGSGESQQWLRMWYDIATLLIEKLMVQFIGNRWVQSCDKRFKEKRRTYLLLILTGLMISTKEAKRKSISILQELQRRSLAYSRRSRAFRRRVHCAWTDDSGRQSPRMDRIPVS